MPLKISDNVRVTLPLEDGDSAVFIFPPYSDPVLQRGIRILLDNRYKQRGRKVENRGTQARIEFFDAHCIGCEGVVDENDEPITKQENWKRMIPPNIKGAIVGAEFEEREVLSDEERDDLVPASDGQVA